MSNSECAASAWVIDWKAVERICPNEWDVFIEQVRLLDADVNHTRPADEPIGVLFGEVAYALHWHDWSEWGIATDSDGITEAIEALCAAFKDKTRLSLALCQNGSNRGGTDDDIPPQHGYWDVDGWVGLTPEAMRFKHQYPTLTVAEKKWQENE